MKACGSPLHRFCLSLRVWKCKLNRDRDTLDIAESRLVDIEQRKKKKAAKENAIYLESFKLLLMHGEEQITKQLKDRGNAA